MRYNSFFTKACMLIISVGLTLLSCEDKPEFSISLHNLEFDSFYTDTVQIDVYSNVKWVVSDTVNWLTIEPMEGKGNGTLNILVSENPEFIERTATIVVSGGGIKETIQILQAPDYDVLPFIIDNGFRQYCLDTLDVNKDGVISTREARMVNRIVINAKQIYSLEGIEHFTRLTYLDCSANLIENLDLSKNVRLELLYCGDNYLERLDLSKNSELIKAFCSYNPISYLDVSGLIKLNELEIFFAELENINVNSNTGLQDLAISGNRISSLDLSSNNELRFLDCSRNLLSSIDVSHNTNLVSLYCNNNRLSTLNLNYNTRLQHLRCDNNMFTGSSLNVSSNTDLMQLGCSGNGLTSLNVSSNLKLERLWCDFNQLTTLDLTNNTKMNTLSCLNNNLTGTLDISNIETLRNLVIDLRNNRLTTIHVPPGFIMFAENNNRIQKDATANWVEKP